MKNFLLKYYPELTGIFVFFVYLSTMSPTISEFDSGELAAVQATWGIAHPTGYPLFSLLGFIFSKIPIPVSTIFKLNFLNVLYCTLTIIIVIKIGGFLITKNEFISNNRFRNILTNNYSKYSVLIASTLGGISLAFSNTFWIQSSKVEVYSLQIFISSLIIYSTLKAFINAGNKSIEDKNDFKFWLLTFVLIGLGLANHMMTVYLVPAIIYLYFCQNKFNKAKIFSFILLSVVTICITSFFYLLMMFRAQMEPPLNWGNVTNIASLYSHVSGKPYSHYMFQGIEVIKQQYLHLLEMFSFDFKTNIFSGESEFSFLLFLGFSGLILSAVIYRKFFFYSLIATVISIFMALNYSIPDIEEYFLITFLFLSLFIVIAAYLIISLLKDRAILTTLIVSTFFILAFLQLGFNYSKIDRSEKFLYSDYPKAVLESLEPASYLLSNEWDFIVAPSIYLQNVEITRPDVTVLLPHFIIYNQWYRQDLKLKYLSFQDFIKQQKNVYVTIEVYRDWIQTGKIRLNLGEQIIPDQLVLKIVKDTLYHPAKDPTLIIRKDNCNLDTDIYLLRLIPFMLEKRVIYELSFNKKEKAKLYFNKIRDLFPEYNISTEVLISLGNQNLLPD
jgi:hypothetical protein